MYWIIEMSTGVILLIGTVLPHRLKLHILHLLDLEGPDVLEIRHVTSIPRVCNQGMLDSVYSFLSACMNVKCTQAPL